MDFINTIPNMVSGFEIKKGELVLLNFWGENSDSAVLDKFAIEIAKVGGVPVKWQQSREFAKNYYTEVPVGNLKFCEKYFEIFKLADVVIDIFMYTPAPHKDFPKDKLPYYVAYMRKLFGSLTEEKRLFIQVTVPTIENAANEGIDYEIYETSVCNALSIDLNKLKNRCSGIVNKLNGKRKICIYTEGSRELTFDLKDRSWYKDDGTGDIPCGEVYIAPVEESAEGTIFISQFYLEGESLSNIILEFKKGKLLHCSSEKLINFINQFSGDKDLIAEFGIGLNENVQNLTGSTLIDEKCIGTAHIAIGMNNLFGGRNSSDLHMDFIFTPVRIEADDELIMSGKSINI